MKNAFYTAQEQTIKLQEEYRQISDKAAKIALLEADNEAVRARVAEAEKRASAAEQERLDAEKALSAEKEKAERDADIASKILEMTVQEAEARENKERERAEKAEKEAESLKKELEDLRNVSFFERVFGWKKKTNKNQE